MGAWGPGLYSSDFAKDLKPIVAAVARLPKSADDLLAILSARFPGVADNPEDEDHTIFWLVVADQFARLGIDSARVRKRALAIIDDGTDLATMASLEMSKADLAKRKAALEKLRPSIANAPARKRKPPLKEPQPYIMSLGECYAFPTSRLHAINPYMGDRAANPGFVQDGWGVGIVAECGRAFEYLAWYRFAVLERRFAEIPESGRLLNERFGVGLGAGTCSPQHFERMELRKIGKLLVDPGALHRLVPELSEARDGNTNAVLDVSIVNNMSVTRETVFGAPEFKGPRLREILKA